VKLPRSTLLPKKKPNDRWPGLSFGIAYSLDAKLENERQLRRLNAARPTRERQKATYY